MKNNHMNLEQANDETDGLLSKDAAKIWFPQNEYYYSYKQFHVFISYLKSSLCDF